MYPKGANMLHMIRQVINDDTKWKSIVMSALKEFKNIMVKENDTWEKLVREII